MPPIRLRLAILLAGVALLAAADPPAEAKLPPAAEAAVASLQKDIGKGYAAYHATVQKASERAAKDLQRAMSDATRKGDLATATAIKAMLDDLTAGRLQERLEGQVRPDVDLLGEVPPDDDVLHAALVKGDWILDRSGSRALLRFEHWSRPDGDPHWSCSIEPDVAITLVNGIRLRFRSAGFGVDGEFVLDPKSGQLTAANGWVIRHPAANEDLPAALGDDGGDNGKVRVGRRRR